MKTGEIRSKGRFDISWARGQALMFVLAALLLTIFNCARTTAQEKSRKKDKADPLELKLTVTAPVLCTGSSIPLSLSITNTGKEAIKVLRSRLWNKFYYSYLGTEGISRIKGGSTIACGGFDLDAVEIPIDLSPGMNYQETHEFSPPEDFFQKAGNYTFRVGYESSLSTVATFRLDDCQL